MIVLDTDHVTELQREASRPGAKLIRRLAIATDRDLRTTIITIEEQVRGRLAVVHRAGPGQGEVPAYAQFLALFEFYKDWMILPFDQHAAAIYDNLRRQKIRIGAMDLKIAAITLAHDATLLTANRKDFNQVPGLRVEDWLRD